jgi:2-hydroxychromene-2-carboxylate isomerase
MPMSMPDEATEMHMAGGAGLRVQFLFDFGSPNAYLAAKVIPAVEQRTGVVFEYVPVLLGGIYKLTGNSSPADYLKGIRNKREQMERENERFIRRHGIATFRKNPFFPVNTLQLMRGAVAAQAEGLFWPYFHAVYHHMWEEPKKMDDPEVMMAALTASGIEVARIAAKSQEPAVKGRLVQLTEDAVVRGAFGSPTFFVGDEMFFGKDQLRDVEEEILAQLPANRGREAKRAAS